MADQVTNYQCPACGGPLHFVGASGKLECDYCDSSFTVAEIEAHYAQADAAAAQAFDEGSEWDASHLCADWGEDAEQMRAYQCTSCGAELICDATTAATACPYCGNPTIVPGQFGGTLRPDYVLPFRLSREQAVAALTAHYRGKRFLPKAFTQENHIEELKGVYVPFWLFDGVADADITFDATRTHTHRRGNTETITTDHFLIHRAGTLTFSRVPVDGASKMPDDLMESIEPYNYADLQPFSTAYLPGFYADKYDVDAKASEKRADERCAASTLEAMRETVHGYETCTVRSQKVRLQRGAVHYALLPVWLLSTRWKEKTFLFAMNGQTGKLVGDLPVDWGRFWATFGLLAAGLSAVFSVVALLLS